MSEILTFVCSICGEPSAEICVECTKDSCRNHRCERCKRCSDCCECDIPLVVQEPEPVHQPEAAGPVSIELVETVLNGHVAIPEPQSSELQAESSEGKPESGDPKPESNEAKPESSEPQEPPHEEF